MNIGLLILRLALGVLVGGHGFQKLTYLFGGDGLAGAAVEFAGDGFRGGRLTALAAGVTQVGAAALLAVGLLTPLAAAGIIGVMVVAAATKLGHGLWAQHDGFEYPLLLALLGVVLAWMGPGHWSLDQVFALSSQWTWEISTAATALGLVGAGGAWVGTHHRRPGGSETGNGPADGSGRDMRSDVDVSAPHFVHLSSSVLHSRSTNQTTHSDRISEREGNTR